MKRGTKWKLALCSFGAPFLAATVALFCPGEAAKNVASFAEWADFVRWQTPLVLALYAAADVAHKTMEAKLAPKDPPSA